MGHYITNEYEEVNGLHLPVPMKGVVQLRDLLHVYHPDMVITSPNNTRKYTAYISLCQQRVLYACCDIEIKFFMPSFQCLSIDQQVSFTKRNVTYIVRYDFCQIFIECPCSKVSSHGS
jgi:hypothetical protein